MLVIKTNCSYKREKEYIFDQIFNNFLKYKEFKVIYDDNISNYFELNFKNKSVFFRDVFFNKKNNIYSNHKIKYKLKYFNEINYKKFQIPFFFYSTKEVLNNKNKYEYDLFGSIFYFISGYEVYLNNQIKDEFGRFDYSCSLIYKNNLLLRPLVNEYLELLRYKLLNINLNIKLKRHFSFFLSHDIDRIFSYKKGIISFVKSCFADLIYRKSLFLFLRRLFSKIIFINRIRNRIDPYNSINYLLFIAKKYNIKSTFYFMVKTNENRNELDSNYFLEGEFFKKKIKKILKNKCHVGIHPSLNSNISFSQLKKEFEILNKFLNSNNKSLSKSRNHYLVHNNLIFENLEKLGIKEDSSIGYDLMNGFWSGCCFEYKPFNFNSKKGFNFLTYPLLIMDVNLKNDKNLDTFKKILEITKFYSGNLTFLYHNNYLRTSKEKRFFENLLKYI